MKKAYLSIALTLLMVCSVSAFSFQDVLAGSLGDMVTGRSISMNSLPETTLNVPTTGQVVPGTKVKVAWSYFDEDGDEQVAYIVQLSSDFSFDIPINQGRMGNRNYDIVDVREGGEYYVRVKTKDAYGWGSWSETRRIFVDAEAKSCSDGTSFWQCSSSTPKYCDGGVLIDSCIRCGCPANQKCVNSGVCVKQTCLDGTEYGYCSNDNPYYCMNGQLKRVCSLCGCSNGESCQAGGDCSVSAAVIMEPKTPSTVSVLERIAIFFKGFFGGLFK